MDKLDSTLAEMCACTYYTEHLLLGSRPLVRASARAHQLIIG
jgi:hypothetical protein